MRSEIHETPQALRRLVAASENWPVDHMATAACIVAHGSSLHAALAVQRQLARHGVALRVGTPQQLITTQFERAVAVSQSGRTQSVLDWCEEKNALIVTNHPENVEIPALGIEAGIERAVCATKTVTCTVAALDIYFAPDRDARRQAWTEFAHELERSLSHLRQTARQLAQRMYPLGGRLWIAAGAGMEAVAREAALKIVESSARVCTALEAEDGLHGPIRAIHHADTVVLLGDIPAAVRKRYRAACDHVIDIDAPDGFSSELIVSMATLVLMQMLAREFALLCGTDPDHPEGLSKVTNI
jgi:glucosamine 6-phosphate synthetase-like amidotransferase/phosphosugar isomerase protein